MMTFFRFACKVKKQCWKQQNKVAVFVVINSSAAATHSHRLFG